MQTSSALLPSRDLLAAHGDAAVPVAGRLQLAEFLRAVGVAALADGEERVLLAQRHGREQRCQRRRVLRLARARPRAEAVLGGPAQHRVQRGDMLGRGAAAAADDVDAVLGDEALEPGGELVGAQRIMGVAAAQLGQAGIGQARRSARARSGDRWRTCSAISLGPVAQLRPMTGTPSASTIAVAAAMSVPTSMRAGGLDGDLDHQRQLAPAADEGVPAAVDRGLDLQRVLAGLDQQHVDAARDQALGLDRERGLELAVADMAEARQLGAGADRADDEALAGRRRRN